MILALLAAEEFGWTPQQVGSGAGSSIAVLALILGIFKCYRIMRRPTTSKTCVAALLLVLLAWLLSICGHLASTDSVPEQTVINVATVTVCTLLLFAAIITGTAGLARYDRTRFVQGRAQAIWGVTLGGLMLVGVIAGISIGLIGRARLQEMVEDGAPAANKPIEVPEFNFSLTPRPRWMTLKPKAVNKLACLALRHPRPELYCMVVGESGIGVIELEGFTEVVKSNLAGVAKVLSQSESEKSVNGLRFIHVVSQVRLAGMKLDFVYEHWVAAQQGFAWQVVFWSQASERKALEAEARLTMEGFRLLDPLKDGGGVGMEDVERPAFGYTTRLAQLGWNAWPNATQQDAQVDFGLQRLHEAIVVVPIRFEGDAPDLASVTRALLYTLSFGYPSKGEFDTKPWRPAHGGEGLEITTEREVEGDRFAYVLKVARGKDFAHLVAGWANKPSGNLEFVRRSLDAITLENPKGSAPTLTAGQLKARGLLFNEIGLSYFLRKDYVQAADWFRQAFEVMKADSAILQNLGDALERAGRHEEGRNYLAKYAGKLEGFDGDVCYSRLQVLSGDAAAGNETFLSLIERGLKTEDNCYSWLDLLVTRKEHALARRAAEAWAAKNPSANARRWQAHTLFESGEEHNALGLLEKLSVEVPDDLNVVYDLGEYSNRAGEYSKAAAVADKILGGGKESVRALAILGWSQMGRKWYREAKATFERAAKLAQDDEDIQDAIRQASASLGQGNNSDIKQPIEPVAIPAEVMQAIGSAPPASFASGHPAAWLLRATGYRFEKGKPLRKTLHRRAKMLTTQGVNDFSSIEISFDPLGERIFMNRLEVKDSEGKRVALGSLDDAYVRDPQDGLATHQKVLHLQVPGLQPGHVLEIEVSLEDLAPAKEFPFERHLMHYSMPLAAEAIFIAGDAQGMGAELAQGEGLKNLRTGSLAAWIAPALPAASDEPLSVWPERMSPMLWLGGNAGDWRQVAEAYLKEIEDRLRPDKTIAELAAKLTQGLNTDKEKIAALARHVQREISYQAIEFGVRARRPNASGDTLRQRYGDCKDHALLLHQLLDAAGIPSHLALVNTGWRLQPKLPSLEQFNHMVVHVPALGPGWLLDATDKHLRLDAFPADGLWEAHALVLDASNPRLLPPSPHPPAGSARVESRRTVAPKGQDWHVEEALTLHGYYAAWMRAAFVGLSAQEQTQKAQNLLARQGAAQVQEFRFDAAEDPTQPARLQINYTLRNSLSTSGGKTTAALPALWENDYLSLSFVKERRTPFLFRYPFRFSSEVTVKLPSTPTQASLSALAQRADGKHCVWKLEANPAQPGALELTARFDFEAKPCEEPADQYASFHDAWEAARRAWTRPLEWSAN